MCVTPSSYHVFLWKFVRWKEEGPNLTLDFTTGSDTQGANELLLIESSFMERWNPRMVLSCPRAFQCEGFRNNRTSLKMSNNFLQHFTPKKSNLILVVLYWIWNLIFENQICSYFEWKQSEVKINPFTNKSTCWNSFGNLKLQLFWSSQT